MLWRWVLIYLSVQTPDPNHRSVIDVLPLGKHGYRAVLKQYIAPRVRT